MLNKASMLYATKRVLLATMLVFASIAMGSALAGCDDTEDQIDAAVESLVNEPQEENTVAAPANMTASQEQALNKAHQYLDFMPFSYEGLIAQLEYEQFSIEDATFAADNCGADWREQACKKAADYLDFQPFSQSGLSEQLQYEKFSVEDSDYAAANCGADWNEQAAKKAQQYLELQAFSHGALVDQLLYEGFTPEQAEYGVSQQGI